MNRTAKITFITFLCAVTVVSAVAAYVARGGARKTPLMTVAVGRADVRKTVSLSGTVKAVNDVTLGFERGGRVAAVAARVGDRVKAGQAIASLDASDLGAQLAQAQAAVAAAQARLDSVRRGTRPEAVDVQDRQVTAAQSALDDARRTLAEALQNAYVTADDVVRGKADPLFTDPTGTTPHLSFFVADDALVSELAERRVQLGQSMPAWQASAAAVAASGDPDGGADVAARGIDDVKAFLDGIALALDKTVIAANPGLAQSTLDAWKANIAVARTNMAAAKSAITAGETRLRTASSALEIARSALTLTAAGPTAQDVEVQEAAVRQAEAAMKAVEVQLGKTALRSPIAGVMTQQDAKVGGLAVPGAPVARVISDGTFQIEAVVPEADVAGVEAGAAAQVTLDAYGAGATFAASVVSIDPAKIQTENGAGYKATLAFAEPDARIKDGMAADVRVAAGEKKGVIAVPRQALIMRGGDAYVLTADGPLVVEQKVETGLHGSDGLVEIVSGLSEGDRIAAFGASASGASR